MLARPTSTNPGGCGIDLADDMRMAAPMRLSEQIIIKPAGKSAPARRRRNGYSLDIDKAPIACAEPQEIRAVVGPS